MKRLNISAVRDLTFGRHAGRTFDGFDAEFVVVHGPNESGKSTLAEFLTWAIGGPWRAYANNTEAFRGGGDGKLGGRLLGTIDADTIDLQANFELKNAGTPRDKRTGYVGSTEVDGASFQKFLGGITPADFELMYRCYGASLGDIGSGGSFEKLFADFAMGGTTGVRNPREALEGLRKATNSAETAVKDAQKKIREIDKEIKEARSNPDVVEKLSNERDEIQRRLSVLDSELVEVERRRSLLTRVINGSEHRSNLDQALASLADHPATTPEWLSVIENAAEITDLAERIGSESRNVERAEVDFAASTAAAGMDSSHFDGVTLSALERLEITTATSALVTARNDAANVRTELAGLDAQRIEAETAATNLARTIGLDDSKLARLDLIEPQLIDIENRAGRWKEDSQKAIDAEAELAGEVRRRETTNQTSASPETSRGPDPKLLALAVLVVAGVSVVHWGAALAVAVAVAAYFMIGRPTSSDKEPVTVAGDGEVAYRQGRAEAARRTADEDRRLLDESLGILAVHVTSIDLAQKQIVQLRDLATRRSTVRGLEDRAETLARRLTELEPDVINAERAATALLTPRGIGIGLVNSEFEKWLTKYEAAVNANTRLSSARTAFTNLQRRLGELTASVASDVAGLTPQALAKRVDDAKAAAAKRRAAENVVREAEAQLRGANLDSPEALQLLNEHPDPADLNV
ncbi:MAG: AAA family ATPase, partial [Ilumatobacteraceae bacterium]